MTVVNAAAGFFLAPALPTATFEAAGGVTGLLVGGAIAADAYRSLRVSRRKL